MDALPEESSFALAGGGALIAHRLTQRATQDLDLFTSEARDVLLAAARVADHLSLHGLLAKVTGIGASFRRMVARDPSSPEQTLLDLG